MLVSNAGAGFVRSTGQAREEDLRWLMDVIVMRVVRCRQAPGPHMRRARAGHVVSCRVGDLGGGLGQPFSQIVCATKFAVEAGMNCTASDNAPSLGTNFSRVEQSGIRTEIAPKRAEAGPRNWRNA